MPAKYWLLPLLAFALLVLAYGPARADQEQFVVTYVEFLPAKEDRGGEFLERLSAAGAGRSASPPIKKSSDRTFLCYSRSGRTPPPVKILKTRLRYSVCWIG
jgi:hypothetical protein